MSLVMCMYQYVTLAVASLLRSASPPAPVDHEYLPIGGCGEKVFNKRVGLVTFYGPDGT